MLFNSYIFIFLFLPITLIGYYGLHYVKQRKLATAYLIVMSLWFYGYNNIHYLYVLIVSILLNYVLVHFMHKQQAKKIRKLWFITGIVLNIGILFYFKYYDFFMDNMNQLLEKDMPFLRLALPLGISFYTFQQLSYVIDSYRKECEEYSLLEYVSYVSFFPQLIAGPIVYHDELIPQFREEKNHKICYENMSKGIYSFALGLAKKVLIADVLSQVVNIGYVNLERLNTNSAIVVMIAYALQIYFDFSGYCDMACGIGYMFNVVLPVNFNSPYKATSIVDFWSRWHMTLTRFFTKYVYIPLGGNRKGILRRDMNVLIVFLLSGLWHGAAWTFVLWGLIHGLLNLLDKHFEAIVKKIPKAIRMVVTFLIVTFLWSLFRAAGFWEARELWHQVKLLSFGELYQPITEYFNGLISTTVLYRLGFKVWIRQYPGMLFYGFIVILLYAVCKMKNTQEKVAEFDYSWKKIVVITFLMIVSIVSLSQVSEFLYFNF